MEKIMMAMTIYFDPKYTYEEFKNLEKCGKSANTRPTKVVNNFKQKIKEINLLAFEDFTDEELNMLLDETYEKLCLYTHSSIVVSMMIEVSKNADEDLFIVFFYFMLDFLKVLLYCCLKYLCNDDKDHVDMICLAIGCFFNLSKLDKNKLTPEYINKYKKYLHWDINSHFNDKYEGILKTLKDDIFELQNDVNENRWNINDYILGLLKKDQ